MDETYELLVKAQAQTDEAIAVAKSAMETATVWRTMYEDIREQAFAVARQRDRVTRERHIVDSRLRGLRVQRRVLVH